MSIILIIKNSQRNLIVFLVSYCLLLSLITYGIYSITKVKKKPLIDNVNNPIDEEKEEENKNNGEPSINPNFLLEHPKLVLFNEVCFLWLLISVVVFKKEYYNLVENQYFVMIGIAVFYLLLHTIVNFLLPFCFLSTWENVYHDYWYLLKNYWKSHFNNLGGCLIFFLPLIIMLSLFVIYAVYCQYVKHVEKYQNLANAQRDG